MKLGEIWLVNFPFTDGSSMKLRPVLLVSADKFNADGDVVVLPISSQVFAGDPFGYQLDQTIPAFRLTGLKTASSVKWTKPVTLAGRILQRRLGHLSGKPLDEIRELLRSVFTQAAMDLGLGCGMAEAEGPYHGYYRSAYSSGYWPSAQVNGGYFTPWGYQPYSMAITPTYGGAIYQGNGGMMGWGTYSPTAWEFFVPSYGWGYGFGGGY